MTAGSGAVHVRPLRGEDRAAWDDLWQGYLTFYGEDVDDETTDVVFHRLIDPGYASLQARVAELDGVVCGFAHVHLHPSTWSLADDCYLEDLFVASDVRGRGVARALFDALDDEGREAGWRRLHWLTDADNTTARRLYDHVGALADQVRYTRDLT